MESQIGHYKIIRRLGSGGMGDVFLAYDTKLYRQVALKFLSDRHIDDILLRERFAREARAAAAVNHPHIVTIYEVGEFEGRPYIAMEYIDGQSLNDLIAKKKVSFDLIVDIASQVCTSLAEAHAAGLIHRDIKPTNIHLDEKGRVKILDFGLARIIGEKELSETGSTLGTINYMSPEQVRGEPLTPASDLFSLGVVLYLMISGKLPFRAEYEAAVLYAIVNDAPEPLAALNPDMPAGLIEIVDRLLRKNPAERCQTAQEVQNDLEKCHSIKGPPKIKKSGFLGQAVYWAALLLLGLLAALLFRNVTHKSESPAFPRKMVAVLPFENLGPPEDEYFADGMTDAITTNLAKYQELGVISRASAALYQKSHKKMREIGAELGADYIMTGTIYWDKSGQVARIRINASLIQADKDQYLWAQMYEPPMDRIFSLQSEISADVIRILAPTVPWATHPTEVTEPTKDLKAYDLYLRGNEYFSNTWEQDDIENAIHLYQQAVHQDTNFALAYAMLARGHASMYWEYFDRSEERKEWAKQAAERAMALSPDLVEGHLAMGYYYYHCYLDYDRALGEFESALKNQPNNSDLFNAIGAVERRQGNLEQSVQNFIKALELDPRSHQKAFDVGLSYGMMRQYRPAADYLDRAIMLAPDWPLAYIYKAWLQIIGDGNISKARGILKEAARRVDLSQNRYYWWLLRVIEPDLHKALTMIAPGPDTIAYYLQKAQFNRLLGDFRKESTYADSALTMLKQQLPERNDDPRLQSYLGLAYAGLRRQDSAFMHGEAAVKLLPISQEAFDAPFWIVNLAEIMVIFGENDAAVGQLEYLLSIPGFVSPVYLRIDPLWKGLESNAGFQRLLDTTK